MPKARKNIQRYITCMKKRLIKNHPRKIAADEYSFHRTHGDTREEESISALDTFPMKAALGIYTRPALIDEDYEDIE